MSSYKLTYFNEKVRAEPMRLLFALAGVEYEDCRIKKEDWPALKKTVPNRTLPILEVDGKILPQSKAIERYLAREFNLMGSTAFEMAQCDAVIESIVEAQEDLEPLWMEKEEAKLLALRKQILEDKIKPKLKLLQDNFLEPNGEVFFGKTITVADIDLFNFADYGDAMLAEDPLKDFPKLTALRQKVGKEPKIASWVAKRPVTSF